MVPIGVSRANNSKCCKSRQHKTGTDLAIKTRPFSRVAPKTDFFRSCRILEQKRLSRERFLGVKRRNNARKKEGRALSQAPANPVVHFFCSGFCSGKLGNLSVSRYNNS